ncbi:MAG TPA: DUF1731 domain-containing protein, partial [Bacteroidia bacterium]|nr:DUF1731 domain-containing protein [Bacteroidia bacterium]
VVLSEKGGAFIEMLRPIRLFIGSPLGSGEQYIPWIHIDDICAIYIKAIEDQSMSGVYNAVSPEHVTNRYFTKITAKILGRPLIMPNVPAFLLKFLFGEMASVVLKGSRASCKKLEDTGYVFKYDKLHKALEALLKKD